MLLTTDKLAKNMHGSVNIEKYGNLHRIEERNDKKDETDATRMATTSTTTRSAIRTRSITSKCQPQEQKVKVHRIETHIRTMDGI
jgi:hypothetical protein